MDEFIWRHILMFCNIMIDQVWGGIDDSIFTYNSNFCGAKV